MQNATVLREFVKRLFRIGLECIRILTLCVMRLTFIRTIPIYHIYVALTRNVFCIYKFRSIWELKRSPRYLGTILYTDDHSVAVNK